MSWTTREQAARDNLGVGVSWVFDRVVDLIHDSYTLSLGPGEFFYVDGVDGDNDNNGLTPDAALLTITEALDKCTSENEDYIFVLNYHQPTSESWPIEIQKSAVHIIGMSTPLEPAPVINPSGSTAAFAIGAASYAGSRVEISNLGFTGGSTSGCIEIANTIFGVKIHDCIFGHNYSGAQDGIAVNATYDAPDIEIYNNIFGALLTRNGVRVITNATRGRIHNNIFDRVQNEGVFLGVSAGVTNCWVYDNKFALPSDTAKYAIRIDAGSGGFIDGNSANYGTTQMANNPYYDAGSNHWGLNYKAGVSVLPATS